MAKQARDHDLTHVLREFDIDVGRQHLQVAAQPGRNPDLDGRDVLAEFGNPVRLVATLGGFLGRKCDGEPGVKTI